MKPEDRQNGKGQPDPYKESCSNRKRALVEASHRLNDAIPSIPQKVTPKKADKQCKLRKEYGDASNTHHIFQCKKWTAGRKSHKE